MSESYDILPIIISTRAAAGSRGDETTAKVQQLAADLGFSCRQALVVADGTPVERALVQALDPHGETEPPAVILTCGGTGLTPDDRTPEYTADLLDKEIPGLMEALRAHGRGYTPLAALSRGVAGVAGSTVIVNLPGSPKAVAQGAEVLAELLPHLCNQVADIRTGHEWGAGA